MEYVEKYITTPYILYKFSIAVPIVGMFFAAIYVFFNYNFYEVVFVKKDVYHLFQAEQKLVNGMINDNKTPAQVIPTLKERRDSLEHQIRESYTEQHKEYSAALSSSDSSSHGHSLDDHTDHTDEL